MARTVTSEIEIQALPETVWAVLADFQAYREWNPIEIDMVGEPVAGTRLHHTSKLPGRKPMRFSPIIVAAEPGRLLAWEGRVLFPHLFDVHHRFVLSTAASEGTRLRQSERFSGLLVPFLAKTLRQTLEAFEIANLAIKSRAENIAATSSIHSVISPRPSSVSNASGARKPISSS